MTSSEQGCYMLLLGKACKGKRGMALTFLCLRLHIHAGGYATGIPIPKKIEPGAELDSVQNESHSGNLQRDVPDWRLQLCRSSLKTGGQG